jgi:starch phosphorylase
VFKDFFEVYPHRFQNKTNGVTPRRWIRCCNPKLAALYTKILGNDEWLLDMSKLKSLQHLADDTSF